MSLGKLNLWLRLLAAAYTNIRNETCISSQHLFRCQLLRLSMRIAELAAVFSLKKCTKKMWQLKNLKTLRMLTQFFFLKYGVNKKISLKSQIPPHWVAKEIRASQHFWWNFNLLFLPGTWKHIFSYFHYFFENFIQCVLNILTSSLATQLCVS